MERKTPGEIIGTLEVNAFATICKIPQGGALQARKLASGATMLYWRYTANGKSDRVPIGVYDAKAAPKSLTATARGFSIQAAARRCEELAHIQATNKLTGGYRADEAAKRAAHLAEEEAKRDRTRHTLRALLNDYCDFIKDLGRISHAEARSIFTLHVFEANAKLSNTPALYVTDEDVIALLRTLNEEGKGRTANKLRSYLHAAYGVALSAKAKASIPAKFKNYGITSNPVSLTKRDSEHDRADKNPLSEDQMRAYWNCIKSLDGTRGAALRVHLLTGGQRINQLMRLLRSRTDADRITIFDGKGKPGKPPREHVVPLIPAAAKALEALPKGKGQYVFSTDGGETHLNGATLTKWAQALEHGIEGFQLKRVRSGVETALASLGVSEGIRGELQSHGLSGVQKRHYDGHDYLQEKRNELLRLFNWLNKPKPSNVRQIRAA